jgi:hypothetical protein
VPHAQESGVGEQALTAALGQNSVYVLEPPVAIADLGLILCLGGSVLDALSIQGERI